MKVYCHLQICRSPCLISWYLLVCSVFPSHFLPLAATSNQFVMTLYQHQYCTSLWWWWPNEYPVQMMLEPGIKPQTAEENHKLSIHFPNNIHRWRTWETSLISVYCRHTDWTACECTDLKGDGHWHRLQSGTVPPGTMKASPYSSAQFWPEHSFSPGPLKHRLTVVLDDVVVWTDAH